MNTRTVLLALTAAGLAAAPATAVVPTGTTALLDRPSGLGALPFDGNNHTSVQPHALSADGRYVVFQSGADALLATDENSANNIYRLDRETGDIVQVNTRFDGAQPSPGSASILPTISADGRYVSFISTARNLTPGAPSDGVYVKDLQTGDLQLASAGTGATGAPAPFVLQAVISGDGRHVAFTARGPIATVNAAGVEQTDVFERDLDTHVTRTVSVTPQGLAGGGLSSAAPDIDFHGDAIAFISTSHLSVEADGADDRDVFVRTNIGADET